MITSIHTDSARSRGPLNLPSIEVPKDEAAPLPTLKVEAEDEQLKAASEKYTEKHERLSYMQACMASVNEVRERLGTNSSTWFQEQARDVHGLFQGIVQKLDQLQRQLGRDLTRPEMLRGAQTGESCQACDEQPLTANFGPAHRELQVGQSLICGMLNQCLKARGGSQAHATLCPGTREQWAVLAAEMKEQASVLERIASGSISMDPMFSNDWRSNPNPFYRALIAIAKELDTLRTPAREAIENSKIHANAEICRDTANRLLNSMFRSFAKYDAVYLLVHAQDIFAYLSNKGALEKLFATLPKEKEETSAFDRKLDAFVQQEHAYIQEATDLILSKGDKEALEILGLTSEKSITKAEVVLREDVEGRANNLQQVRAALMHLARHTTDMRTLINRLYGYADNGGKAYCETLDKWWYGYQAVPAKIAELIKSESEAVGQYKNLQTLQSQLLEDVRSFINDGHANQSISFSDEKASEAGVSELKRKINIATKDLEHRLKFVTGKCTEISRFQAEIESRYSDAFSSAEYKEAFAKVCDLLHRMAVTEQLPFDKFRILQENGTLEEVEAGGKMSSKTIRARLDALQKDLDTQLDTANELKTKILRGITEDNRRGYEDDLKAAKADLDGQSDEFSNLNKLVHWRLKRMEQRGNESQKLFRQLQLLDLSQVREELLKRELYQHTAEEADAAQSKARTDLGEGWKQAVQAKSTLGQCIEEIEKLLQPKQKGWWG